MKSLILIALLSLVYFSAQGQADLDTTVAEPAMVLVDGGTFQMGSANGLKNEQPPHSVHLKSFYIGQYEVTQAFWENIMGSKPSSFNGCDFCPVETISLPLIEIFLKRLNAQTGKRYRLPTEAEWEYAATGGSKSKGYKYSGSNNLDEVAWYENNAENKTHPVGQKKPNELGIYDMSGNVWEMCSDWFDTAYYKNSPGTNPRNDKKALHRVVRGGSWRSPKERCYSKARNRDIGDHHKQNGGFRLVLDI